MAYISNLASFGTPATSASGNSYVWNRGAGLYASLGSQYSIANVQYGGPILAVDAAGGVAIGSYALNVQSVAPPANGLIVSGNVGIGTALPQYKLAVNGAIGAKEVIVTNTGWPDYVFRPGYRLRRLGEIGAYIQAHRHLPGIPSEAEVRKKGVSVGEMQARLLAKIEELTLHMIQAEERSNRLAQQNQELRGRIERLEKSAASEGTPAAAK